MLPHGKPNGDIWSVYAAKPYVVSFWQACYTDYEFNRLCTRFVIWLNVFAVNVCS